MKWRSTTVNRRHAGCEYPEGIVRIGRGDSGIPPHIRFLSKGLAQLLGCEDAFDFLYDFGRERLGSMGIPPHDVA